MDLGIDLGTTYTVAAAVDRGNYPVVAFTDLDGDSHEHFPSVTAVVDGALVHGYEALDAVTRGAPAIRSLKRALASSSVTSSTTVRIGTRSFTLGEVLTDYLTTVAGQIREATGAPELRAVIGVPAHAHTGQRFVTMEAFRAAGIEVLGIVNEPSAAGLEYALRQARSLNSRRTRVLVYDLGGGTFDASLVDMSGTQGEVVDSVGLNDLGGDDFDGVLEGLVRSLVTTPMPGTEDLRESCRLAKEAIRPQSRHVVVDLPDEAVRVPVADYERACRSLVDRTLAVMEPLSGLLADDPGHSDVAGIHMVGGATCLPVVARRVREVYGRRVHRSPHPTSATAVGLAIAADPDSVYGIRDRLSRGFGVFRETDAGRAVSFDVLVDQTTLLDGSTTVSRRYQARHNLGVYRFVEFQRAEDGVPRGDLTPFATVVVPLDAALQAGEAPLDPTDVHEVEHGHWVEERYVVEPTGIVRATVTDLDTGWSLTTTMGVDRPDVRRA
ncbi:Hsp70 family protein [Acidipropionibacterium timonense]|uniref:Hsp70 family protein n=1 Tax=Acidipropionibacterium timonense TaxID=2161818 RepID=UPI00102FA6AB|nr:Hsp70 family protein [Acidipropionibacterium timonense]